MATTVIDQLIVTLGLDPKGFKKGQREADKALKSAKDSVKSASADMSKAIAGVAKEFALAFLGFESAVGLAKMLASLNDATTQLGRLAANTGIAASELKNWQNATELAGGSAEDFNATVNEIQKQQTSFSLTGQASWLGYLRQLKVGLLDLNGNPRSPLQLLLELSERFTHLSRPQAFQIGQQMGLTPGILNLLLQGPSAIQSLIDKQHDLHQITKDDTDASAQLSASWTLLMQQGKSLGQDLLTKIAPALQAVFNGIQSIVQAFKGGEAGAGTFGKAIMYVKDIFILIASAVRLVIAGLVALGHLWANSAFGKFVDNAIGNVIHKVATLVHSAAGAASSTTAAVEAKVYGNTTDPTKSGAAVNRATAAATTPGGGNRGLRNNNPGNIEYGPFAIKHGAIGTDGRFAIFPTIEIGRAAANSLLDSYQRQGINTIGGIINRYAPKKDHNDVVAYGAALSKATGRGLNDQLLPSDRAALLAAIFAHESGAGAGSFVAAAGAARGAGAATGLLASQRGGAAAGNVTTVDIDQITVHTAATDANGVAAGIDKAMQRRLSASQTDTGQRS